MIKKSYFVFGLIFIFLFSCEQKTKIKSQNQDFIPVKVMPVKLKDITYSLEYTGNIQAENQALIYPKVSGRVFQKVKEESEFIKKDEVILYIERDEVGLKFEKAPVLSSLEGLIGKIFVDLGEWVNPQLAVALVVDIKRVKINLEIPQNYAGLISLGLKAKVSVDAYPDKEFLGEVTKVVPVVDLATRSFPVEITLDNPENLLKPGMFAKVRLILKEFKDVPVILKEAVLGREPDLYVYVVENNQAYLRKIKTGLKEGPYLQVIEGLNPGDLVVIMGQQRLYEGAKVKSHIEER
ncbi:MAG: efflux RND transporter periplasmic adaptor subunit [Candidatus Omnitrophica bacterium]|nr:efflux RND transporter periplasmic adaptor subunit [Candidatus Omnitrophota bacterium]